MKLLHCKACGDVVRLYTESRSCHCGKSRGRYDNDTIVRLDGPCRALGIDTKELYGDGGKWHVSKNVVKGN